MKKYLKILGVAVIIGGGIAYFFYYDINKEVRAISKKEEIVTLFQTGVFKDYNNATSFAATFSSSYVYKDSEYYRVIIAVCYHKETKLKLESIFNSEEIEYYEKEIGYHIPERTPFVGKNFNVTRAGIHADGLLKNEEIYNIFDTDKFLNRPPLVAISNTSGLAGIAHWINTYFKLPDDKKVDKNSELVNAVKDWVDEQYEEGRVTVLTDDELIAVIDQNCKRLGIDLI